MNKQEVWVDFKHCEGYMISSLGNFKSKDRVVNYSDGRRYEYKGVIIKPYIHNSGYYYVRTKVNGVVRRFPLHRETARHFLKEWDEGRVVDHIDGNVLNNAVVNLQMLTLVDNILKGIHMDGKRRDVKLSYSIACEIREEYATGVSGFVLAKKYGVSSSTIYSIINFKRYKPTTYENSVWIETDNKNVRIVR